MRREEGFGFGREAVSPCCGHITRWTITTLKKIKHHNVQELAETWLVSLCCSSGRRWNLTLLMAGVTQARWRGAQAVEAVSAFREGIKRGGTEQHVIEDGDNCCRKQETDMIAGFSTHRINLI